MNNIEMLNAMSKEGQRNMLINYFRKWEREKLFIRLLDSEINRMVDDFMDWLYDKK